MLGHNKSLKYKRHKYTVWYITSISVTILGLFSQTTEVAMDEHVLGGLVHAALVKIHNDNTNDRSKQRKLTVKSRRGKVRYT